MRPKFGNRKVTIDGIEFASEKEGRRYRELVLLERAGQIANLIAHPPFRLEVNGQLVCKYVGDFAYQEGGQTVVEDVKSPITRKNRAYRLKNKLMKAVHGITIREV
jgi:hypothetical protein